MANADFTIRGDTKLDGTGFTKGLDKVDEAAQKGAEKLGSATEKRVNKLSELAKKGLAVVSAASAGALTAIAATGVKYNASMEQYQTAFETMLGSAKAADTLTESLKTLAAQTPMAMSDLADASKTLLAFGTTADALPGTLKRLGDIALGNAEKLGTMATAFGRIQSNGRASMEEINMMIDQGFNPLNIIAKKTGESMEALRERVSDGGVSFKEISDAIEVATNKGGQFYNAMEAQSQTLNGQLSTLADNASALAGAFAQGLSDTLSGELLPTVNGWVDELLTAVQEKGVKGAISVSGEILAEASQMFGAGALNIANAAVDVLTMFLPKEISRPIKAAVDGITKTLKNGGIDKITGTLTKSFENLSRAAGDIAKKVLPVFNKAFDFAVDNFDTLVPLLGAVVSGMKTYKIVQNAAKWTSSLTAAAKAASAAMTAESLSTAAATGALTLKQAAVGVLTGKIGLATAAQGLWNAAMTANPIGIITVAVAGLAAVIGGLVLNMEHEADASDKVLEKSRRRREEMEELNAKYEETKQAAQEAAEADLVQVAHVEELADELMGLADANGRVKDADKARADFILGQLNSALGKEYELTGNQIQQYEDLKNSVYKAIDAKKAEILLSAHEEEYKAAIQARAEAEQKQAESYAALQRNHQEISDATIQRDAANAEYEKAIQEGLSTFEIQRIADKRDQYEEERRIASERTEELQNEYLNNKAAYETYISDINNYESAYAAMLEGNTEKAIALLDGQGQAYIDAKELAGKSAEEQARILQEQYDVALAKLKLYEINYKNGVAGYTAEGLEVLRQSAEDLKAEAETMGFNIVDGSVKGIDDNKEILFEKTRALGVGALAAAQVALAIRSPSRKFRDKVGKMIPAGTAIGIEQGAPLVDSASEEMAEHAVLQAKAGIAAFQAQIAMEHSSPAETSYISQQQTSTTQNIQNITFEQPMQAPDEIARELRILQTYGLAGAR